MIRESSFEQRWQAKETKLGIQEIGSRFVNCFGQVLPDSAAPCLSFDGQGQELWEVYGSASDWSPDDRARLASYRVIGSDGAGNPICIERDTGAIWLLDHEDQFTSRQFVNTGLPELAESLLAYMGEKDLEQFRSELRRVDSAAAREGCFWWCEAATLDAT